MVVPRFSKSYVRQVIDERLAELSKRYKFDPNVGWAQVIGKSGEVNRAYGSFDELLLLRDILNL